MRHLISFISFLSLSVVLSFGQTIEMVSHVEPVKYEKIEGRVQILSFIKTSSAVSSSMTFRLNGKPLKAIGKESGDSISVWLPMFGTYNRISLYDGQDKLLCEKMVPASVNSDWGYFAKGTIYLLQSSHQDIGWMNTPEYCRNERIEQIVKPALDFMKTDSQFAYEMEQSLNLMEFLERYPERKQEIIQRYKEGRFTWGGTYTQPYEGILSGEQLVRQVYYGRKWIKDSLGCDEYIAYNIDVPGRAMQVPQIYAKSGLKTLFISRMYEGFYDWYSPDGTKLTTYSCTKYDYPTTVLNYFQKDVLTAMVRLNPTLRLASDKYRQYALPTNYPVVMSCDAKFPENMNKLIDEWNRISDMAEIPLPHLRLSTAESFFSLMQTPGKEFEKVYGERPNLWLYIHGSAHHNMYSDKRRAAITLPAAEALLSVEDATLKDGIQYPSKKFFRAWMASIYPDHGIGGKNGTITDSVFADSLSTARKIGDETLLSGVTRIADNLKAPQGSLVVYNDLTWDRNDVVKYPSSKPMSVYYLNSGQEIPSQMTSDGKLCFIAKVPSVGYNTFKLSSKTSSLKSDIKYDQGENFYDGKYYKMVLGDGGIVSLYDKQLGRELYKKDRYAFGDIMNAPYSGNGAGEFLKITNLGKMDFYNEKPAYNLFSWSSTKWSMTETGPVFTSFETSKKMKCATVIEKITIYHEIKKIDIDVTIQDFDGEHGRQFRILFPLNNNWRDSKINYEVPYAVAQVGRDEMNRVANGFNINGTYDNNPKESHPREIQNFISASGNGIGFTLASSVNTADWIDPCYNREYYTVLQGVLLSSHHSCHGEGEWYSQEGTHKYHFSILGHKEGWENGYHYALESNHPFSTVTKNSKPGKLLAENSLIKISDPFVGLSTLKKSDDGKGYILRLVEMEGKDKEVEVTLPFNVKEIVKTNLIEQEENGKIPASGNVLKFKIGHNAVEAYKLIL